MNGSKSHWKGRLILLLALPLLLAGMLLAAPTGLAVAQEESPFGEDVVTATTTANLRIRSEPSLDAEILAVLPLGTVVGFTGFTDESGDWALVDAADGPTGWVSVAFLSNVPELTALSDDEVAVESDEAEVAEEEPPFSDDVVTATTTANLRIRSEPGLDAETLAILPFGTVVGFTGFTDESGDWVLVDAADGPTGWVSAAYLSNVPDLTALSADETAAEAVESDEAEVTEEESPFSEDVVTATTTANLRIRSEPSLDAETLATLPFGTIVGFTGFTDESGDWVLVDAADGPTGWVWAEFLSNVPEGLTAWTGDD